MIAPPIIKTRSPNHPSHPKHDRPLTPQKHDRPIILFTKTRSPTHHLTKPNRQIPTQKTRSPNHLIKNAIAQQNMIAQPLTKNAIALETDILYQSN